MSATSGDVVGFGYGWGYQHHYCIEVAVLAEQALNQLGLDLKPQAFAVSRLITQRGESLVFIVDERIDSSTESVFVDLPNVFRTHVADHPEHQRFQTHPELSREKPERILGDSLRLAVAECMTRIDADDGFLSFVGGHAAVASKYQNAPVFFDVVPVVRIPRTAIDAGGRLDHDVRVNEFFEPEPRSLVEAVMKAVLREATQELRAAEPGGRKGGDMRNAREVAVRAARSFAAVPGIALGDIEAALTLFDTLNLISSLSYEGADSIGFLILATPDNPSVSYDIRFVEPVPLRDFRWARKVIEMASAEIGVVAVPGKIHGLGHVDDADVSTDNDLFVVRFHGRYRWELRYRERVMMLCDYGVPRLPRRPFDRSRFVSNFGRIFPRSEEGDAERAWSLCEHAVTMNRGCMLVYADSAADEAARLARQATQIVPTLLTGKLLDRAASVDGSILLDEHGVCHAIGVILDGSAHDSCTPSRGSRYNSAIRYVRDTIRGRLAIVISDDQTIDIMPTLRPQISRDEVEAQLLALESAPPDEHHSALRWLNEHRFYLTPAQCQRANAVLERIDQAPKEVARLYVVTPEFTPALDLDDSYFFETEGEP